MLFFQAQYEVFQDLTVQRAFTVASKAHAGQQRRNGEPVFVHCVETARTLAELGLTADVVAAGLLHDILDDTLMTEPQLRSHFSHPLVDMVCKVSRMSTICQLNRDQQADRPLDRAKLTDTLMCMADPRCVLIKLADRLHNMRTVAALPEQKRQRMAQESMDIFSPLANRLGVWSLKAELEDLCFQQLHPVQHSQLQKRLKESQHRGSIELALNKLSQHLDCIGKSSAISQTVYAQDMQTCISCAYKRLNIPPSPAILQLHKLLLLLFLVIGLLYMAYPNGC